MSPTPIQVRAARDVDAAPAKVYDVLRDYREHHPRILPKPYFEACDVLEGGVGAGTVLDVRMKVMGARQRLRLVVSEPQPGRVLEERDDAKGVVTRFHVEPLDGGARSRVAIETQSPGRGGFGGWLERKVTASVSGRIFKKELDQLAGYVASLR